MRRDLAGAKDVQQALFPSESLSIPCMACQTFYQPAHEIGGDYYDFFSLLDDGASQLEMYPGKELVQP